MKKRDYYVLACLVCIIAYAASHRKIDKNAEILSSGELLQESHVKAGIQPLKNDSIKNNTPIVFKAGV